MISDEDYKGLKTEITACMCLCPKNEGDRGYNQGMQKALRFIEQYHKGEGLMQQSSGDTGDKTE